MVRKIFAGIFLFLFITFSVPVFLLWGINRTFLNENFFRQDFSGLAYEFLTDEMPRLISLDPALSVSEEDLSGLLREVIEKKDVEMVIDSIIDQIQAIDLKDKEQIQIIVSLDFTPEKRQLIAEKFSAFLFEKLEPCVEENNPGNESVVELSCLPQNISEANFTLMISRELEDKVFKKWPVDIAIPDSVSGPLTDFVTDTLDLVILIGISFLVILLILIGLFIFKPLPKVVRWESITIFIASVNLLLILLPLSFGAEIFALIDNYAGLNLDKSQTDLYLRIYDGIIGYFARSLVVFVIPVFLVSLTVWIFGVIYDRKNNKKIADDPS